MATVIIEEEKILPTVVRIRRSGGVIVQDCDVYIGRRMTMGGWSLEGSKFSNPFTVKEYGRDECLLKYEEYIRKRPDLMAALPELNGKRLGCFCCPVPWRYSRKVIQGNPVSCNILTMHGQNIKSMPYNMRVNRNDSVYLVTT